MDKEQTAIERLRMASEMSLKHYGTTLVVTTSGGKDSAVCIALAERAGIPFEVIHNHTTVDAPETVRFVREDFHRLEEKGVKCTINFPIYKGQRVTMWSLIPQMLMPPTRLSRYCCSVLKERGGRGRFIVTGVRWAESVKRKNNRGIYETMPSDRKKKIILNNDNDDRRRLFETCALKAKRACNPIIDWTDREIWDYIHAEHIPVNPLYRCGYSRVGCIGCPMAGTAGRQRGFARYPTYQRQILRLCGMANGYDLGGAKAQNPDCMGQAAPYRGRPHRGLREPSRVDPIRAQGPPHFEEWQTGQFMEYLTPARWRTSNAETRRACEVIAFDDEGRLAYPIKREEAGP